MRYGSFARTVTVPVPKNKQQVFCLTDEQVYTLARHAIEIRQHYGVPMDIEWALGNNDKIYIVQARPETVHSQKGDTEEIFYLLEQADELIKNGLLIENTGTAIGRRIGYGNIKVIGIRDAGAIDGIVRQVHYQLRASITRVEEEHM